MANSRAAARDVVVALAIAVVCLPVAFIGTILLFPLWSWIEATYHYESVGHSGPADWCFEVVYVVLLLLALGGYALQSARAGRTRN